MNRRLKMLEILLACVAVLIIVSIIYDAREVIWKVITTQDLDYLETYLMSTKDTGYILLVILSALQVAVFFVPSAVIQFAAGAIYGPIFGTLLCCFGFMVGVTIMYYVWRYAYEALLKSSVGFSSSSLYKKLQRYLYLTDFKKKQWLIILMFIVPVVPNWAKPILGVIMGVSIKEFVVLGGFASLVPIFLSANVGRSLMDGNYTTAILNVLIIGISIIISFIVNYVLKRKSATK